MVNETIKLDVALLHHPVCNKLGEIIGSAVTNLDVHDIGRAGKTFGVGTFYIVTPFADQQNLIQEILDHWLTGYGSTRNPDRKEALAIVEICEDFQTLQNKVNHKWGRPPVVLATCAQERPDTLGYAKVKEQLLAGEPHLLIFGTAWGLAPEVFEKVDATLPPIVGAGEYNHLSVRSAVSIVLDRLVGQ